MKTRILVIDDEPAIRDTMRMILEYDGHEVFTAGSGQEGLTMAERETPDLVFLDIKMPGLDGPFTAWLDRARTRHGHGGPLADP